MCFVIRCFISASVSHQYFNDYLSGLPTHQHPSHHPAGFVQWEVFSILCCRSVLSAVSTWVMSDLKLCWLVDQSNVYYSEMEYAALLDTHLQSWPKCTVSVLGVPKQLQGTLPVQSLLAVVFSWNESGHDDLRSRSNSGSLTCFSLHYVARWTQPERARWGRVAGSAGSAARCVWLCLIAGVVRSEAEENTKKKKETTSWKVLRRPGCKMKMSQLLCTLTFHHWLSILES